MSFKTTYILFGILAGMILLLTLTLWNGPLPEVNKTRVFPSTKDELNPVNVAKITEVVIDQDKPTKEKLVFARDKETGNWNITEPRQMRGSSTAITSLIDEILEA